MTTDVRLDMSWIRRMIRTCKGNEGEEGLLFTELSKVVG